MTTRRGFIASLLAAGSLPALSWADAGSPAYLAAAREIDGGFALFGLTADGRDVFRIPLPARGHAAAAHPTRPEAVAFARRPGTYALVIDCVSGDVTERLEAPEGHHFYGHGCFLANGDLLCTPENRFETGEGRIGLWSRREGYARIGEVASGGMGPHDTLRLPGTEVMAVANGGIRTHPAHGRDKLNLDTMEPNLAYVDIDKGVLEQVALAPDLHRNSIRHLDVRPDGTVAFAMQWQGDLSDPVPLLGLHRRGAALRLLEPPLTEALAMKGYAGSVAFSGTGEEVAITSPRGGRMQVFSVDGRFSRSVLRGDICGLAKARSGFFASDGQGALHAIGADGRTTLAAAPRAWDNHVVTLQRVG